MSYYFSKKSALGFEEAIQKVTEALKSEGFGILTEIDVREILKKKLDVDFRPYRILGACNPPFAYKALQTEDKVGIMLAMQCYHPGKRKWSRNRCGRSCGVDASN